MANPDPNKVLQELSETVEILKDSFNSLGAIIKNSITNNISDADNITKAYGRTLSNDISRGLSDLGRKSDKIVNNQNLLNVGQAKSKDIQKQLNELDNKKSKILGDINNAYKNNLISLNDQINLKGELVQKLQEENLLLTQQFQTAEKIESILGNTGKIVAGMKEIPLFGKFVEAEKILEAMQLAAANTQSKTLTMLAGIKAFGSSIKNALLDPLTLITFFLNRAITTNKQSVEIGKQLGYGADNANRLQSNFRDIERSSSNLNINTRNLNEAFNELSTATGFVTEYSADALTTQIKLTKQLGLTGDEAASLYKFSILTGKSSEETYQSMLRGYTATRNSLRVGVPFKAAIAEAAKVTGQLAANMGYNLENTIKGVVATKALGTSLEQAKSQGESLLDFQSSIENELKAELITGQQLNLERARAAALMGDQVTVAEELAAQGMTATKFAQMNVIAQKSYAQALGTTSDELANQLQKRELAIASGKSLAQITAEEADEAARRQDIQTKFNTAVEKLQSIIGNLVAGPLGTMLEILSQSLNLISSIGLGLTAWYTTSKLIAGSQALIAWYSKQKLIADNLQVGVGTVILSQLGRMLGLSIAKASAETAAATAISFGTLLPVILGAGVAAYSLFKSFNADDMISPGYGKRTILSPEGAIKLNDNDTIIAGTNLGINNSPARSSSVIDLTPMIAAINDVKGAVDTLNNKSWDVKLDSKSVGTGLMQKSYKSA